MRINIFVHTRGLRKVDGYEDRCIPKGKRVMRAAKDKDTLMQKGKSMVHVGREGYYINLQEELQEAIRGKSGLIVLGI